MWHEVILKPTVSGYPVEWVQRHRRYTECVRWCEINISSAGVLWKRDDIYPGIFYFAQYDDAVVFKLVNG